MPKALIQELSEARASLVEGYVREGNWDQVYSTCLDALETLSSLRFDGYKASEEISGQLHYQLAHAYIHQGRPDSAIIQLKLSTHYLPNHVHAYRDLGQICREEGRIREAVHYLARALTLKYDAPDTLLAFRSALAQRQVQIKNTLPSAAREAFDSGFALYSKQNFTEAILYFQIAHKAAPDFAEALSYRGLCQLILQNPHGLDDIKQAAQIAPENADVLTHLAWCYANMGQLEKATHLYLNAIQMQPTHVTAYVELGKLYQKQGQWAKASEALKRARYFDQDKTLDPQILLALCEGWVKAEPQNAQAHYQLALRHIAADNWPLTIAESTTALLYGCNQTDVYAYLGLAFSETKTWPKAIQSIETALSREPEQPLWHILLSYIYFIGSQDTTRAVAECEHALYCLEKQSHLPDIAALRRLILRMIDKIKHPSRDDQAFWNSTRRQIRAEVTYGI